MRGVLVPLSALVLSVGCEAFQPTKTVAVQTIGPEGGEFVSLDGNFRIVFPAGALDSDVELQMTENYDAPVGHIGKAYNIRPNRGLAMPATFIYDFGDTDIGRPPEVLNIGGNFDHSGWTPLERVAVDTTAQTVTATDLRLAYDYGLIQDDDAGETGESETTDSMESSTTGMGSTTTEGGTTTSGDTTGSGEETGETGPGTSTSTSAAESEAESEGETTSDSANNPECGNGTVDPGEICLSERLNFAAPEAPSSVATADFDADGNLDLVIAGQGADAIYVLHGNGAGNLGNRDSYDVGVAPLGVVAADFASGAGPDVAVLASGANAAELLVNADGALGANTSVALDGEGPVAILGALLDADDILDVAVLNGVSGDITILLGDGDGALELGDSPVAADTAAAAFTVGDFNGDGDLDLISVSATNISAIAGNGSGLFGAPEQSAIASAGQALVVGHFNGDANLDVAVAHVNDRVTVYAGDNIGGFGAGVPYAVGTNPVAIVLADITGDGTPDLVVANAGDGTASILPGEGDGFGDEVVVNVGQSPSSIAVGDFNGDGALDIVAANADDDEVTLVLSDP